MSSRVADVPLRVVTLVAFTCMAAFGACAVDAQQQPPGQTTDGGRHPQPAESDTSVPDSPRDRLRAAIRQDYQISDEMNDRRLDGLRQAASDPETGSEVRRNLHEGAVRFHSIVTLELHVQPGDELSSDAMEVTSPLARRSPDPPLHLPTIRHVSTPVRLRSAISEFSQRVHQADQQLAEIIDITKLPIERRIAVLVYVGPLTELDARLHLRFSEPADSQTDPRRMPPPTIDLEALLSQLQQVSPRNWLIIIDGCWRGRAPESPDEDLPLPAAPIDMTILIGFGPESGTCQLGKLAASSRLAIGNFLQHAVAQATQSSDTPPQDVDALLADIAARYRIMSTDRILKVDRNGVSVLSPRAEL